MLDTRIRLYQNPYSEMISDPELIAILNRIAERRAIHIEVQVVEGHYERSSFAFCILDPTAPNWKPSPETILAVISIGSEGDRFIPNAIAKSLQHRDSGQLAGYAAYVDLVMVGNGMFTYGFSTQVDNTIGGGSGENELQDAAEVGYALVSFNYHIRDCIKVWKHNTTVNPTATPAGEQHRWFSQNDQPSDVVIALSVTTEVLYDNRPEAA